MLLERVQGENSFSRVTDPVEQEATARDFMSKLAALHSLDVGDDAMSAFPRFTSVADAVVGELTSGVCAGGTGRRA